MNTHTMLQDGPESSLASEVTEADLSPKGARRWVFRGAAVGAILGPTYGSIIPIVGTIVGCAVGLAAGTILGVVVGVLSALCRRVAPKNRDMTLRRERVICCLVIVLGAIGIAVQAYPHLGAFPVFVMGPAVLGIVHSFLAGLPVAAAPYSGDATGRARTAVRRMPYVIIGLIACGWLVAALIAWAT